MKLTTKIKILQTVLFALWLWGVVGQLTYLIWWWHSPYMAGIYIVGVVLMLLLLLASVLTVHYVKQIEKEINEK